MREQGKHKGSERKTFGVCGIFLKIPTLSPYPEHSERWELYTPPPVNNYEYFSLNWGGAISFAFLFSL